MNERFTDILGTIGAFMITVGVISFLLVMAFSLFAGMFSFTLNEPSLLLVIVAATVVSSYLFYKEHNQ